MLGRTRSTSLLGGCTVTAMMPAPRFSPNAIRVLERRYLHEGESPEGMLRRVAAGVAAAEPRYGEDAPRVAERFYASMARLEFLPNTPTLMNAGRPEGQLAACFVLPIDDSLDGIFETLKQAARIHQSGGGCGYSFSRLRPRNDVVKKTQGVSSGPVSFMQVYDAATETIKQGSARRGANMGILRVDHPDIEEFVTAKRRPGVLTNFNVSVAITDSFMRAVERGESYALVNPRTGETVGTRQAREVFDLIVESAWASGEPGVVFIDRINADHPTPQVGEIESTNPCGEQPLPAYESCTLGSIDVSKFDAGGKLERDRLAEAVHLGVRFLDDVIDVNAYPLSEIATATRASRRIGLGVMGLADLLALRGVPYDSDEGIAVAEEIATFVQTESKRASRDLTAARGVFPAWEGSAYDGPPADAAATGIHRYRGEKLRNATTTTVAPTGTISILAGCSGGIEPIYALAFRRNVLDGESLVEVSSAFERVASRQGFDSEALRAHVARKGSIRGRADVPERWQRALVTAPEVSPEWHVKMQAVWQKHVDAGVSKTINFPKGATVDDVRRSYLDAYRSGCKGITVYRDGSRGAQVLESGV